MSDLGPPKVRTTAELYAGADNRFLLFEELAEVDWPTRARELCATPLFQGSRADGLLVLGEAAGADARMTIYNADGGRPEACGNGLRCVGWHLARARGLDRALVETDAGPRQVRVDERDGVRATLRAEMGVARSLEVRAPLPSDSGARVVRGYDLGNPHCILVVDDERHAPLARVGRALQAHADFPRGVNVGFLARREGRWHLRVWERGVGETAACGTNACAAAAYLIEHEGVRQHELHMHGGVLRVTAAPSGALELRGVASHHGSLDLSSAGVWAT